MCDIIVVIAKDEPVRFGDVKEIWENLDSVLAEPHGWGYLYLGVDGKIRVKKTINKGVARAMFENLKRNSGWFLVIHGRTKSAGVVNLRNAHPVEWRVGRRRYYLVHNGTTHIVRTGKLSDTLMLLATLVPVNEEKGEEVAVELLRESSGFFVWYNALKRDFVVVNNYGSSSGYYSYGYGFGYGLDYGWRRSWGFDEYLLRETEKYYVITKHFEIGDSFDEIKVVPSFDEKGRVVGLSVEIAGREKMDERVLDVGVEERAENEVVLLGDLSKYSSGLLSGKVLRRKINRFMSRLRNAVFDEEFADSILEEIVFAKEKALDLNDVSTLNALNGLERFVEKRISRMVAEIVEGEEEDKSEYGEVLMPIDEASAIIARLSDGGGEDVSIDEGLKAIWSAYGESYFMVDTLSEALLVVGEKILSMGITRKTVEYMVRWVSLLSLLFEDLGDDELREKLLRVFADIVEHGGDSLVNALLKEEPDVIDDLIGTAVEMAEESEAAKNVLDVLRNYLDFDVYF